MSRKAHITIVPSGMRLSLALVCAGIEACSMLWVEPNVSARMATELEAIQLRNQQAARSERLAPSELRKIVFVVPPRLQAGHRLERQLARNAYTFANALPGALRFLEAS